MSSASWSYPLIAAGVRDIVEGDVLMLKEAASAVDRRMAVRLAGFGCLQVAKGAFALHAARPSTSDEVKKLATVIAVATDAFVIGQIAYLMYKGYDTSQDMLYGPVAALLCAIEAGTLVATMRHKF